MSRKNTEQCIRRPARWTLFHRDDINTFEAYLGKWGNVSNRLSVAQIKCVQSW